METLLDYVNFNPVNEKLLNYVEYNHVNENEEGNVEDKNWNELKNEILEEFKKLNPYEKRVFLQELEESISEEEKEIKTS